MTPPPACWSCFLLSGLIQRHGLSLLSSAVRPSLHWAAGSELTLLLPMHSSYLCLLKEINKKKTSTLQQNEIASDMFTAFSKTLSAGSLTWKGLRDGEGVNHYWRKLWPWLKCLFLICGFLSCGETCWPSIILQEQCVSCSMASRLGSENTYREVLHEYLRKGSYSSFWISVTLDF